MLQNSDQPSRIENPVTVKAELSRKHDEIEEEIGSVLNENTSRRTAISLENREIFRYEDNDGRTLYHWIDDEGDYALHGEWEWIREIADETDAEFTYQGNNLEQNTV